MILNAKQVLLDWDDQPIKSGFLANGLPDPKSPNLTLRDVVGSSLNHWEEQPNPMNPKQFTTGAEPDPAPTPEDTYRRFRLCQVFSTGELVEGLDEPDADYIMQRVSKRYAKWPLVYGRTKEIFDNAKKFDNKAAEGGEPPAKPNREEKGEDA